MLASLEHEEENAGRDRQLVAAWYLGDKEGSVASPSLALMRIGASGVVVSTTILEGHKPSKMIRWARREVDGRRKFPEVQRVELYENDRTKSTHMLILGA